MARDFKILDVDKVPWLFLDDFSGSSRYISYRHFIEQILLFLLCENDGNIQKAKDAFKEFITAFENKSSYPSENLKYPPLSLRLYWFKDCDEHGVLVDDTNWCYPLIVDKPGRANALAFAISNINDRIDDVLVVLNEYAVVGAEWDMELQGRMDEFDDRPRAEAA